jgi:histidinol-phosphate/aromatic aminotransferase/cobyric acid decarboxylase-like protein
VRFPLADWIDDHADCRFSFGSSGMAGVVRPPEPSARRLRTATEAELRDRLADLMSVASDRVFLSPGATESNAWATWFVARSARGRAPRCRVEYPEYPPLFDGPRAAGFRLVRPSADLAELAVVSQPRNPAGDLWSQDRLSDFAAGARSTIVDETFREFTGVPSTLRWGIPGQWATGSFTKAYGGDALRVGFVVPPERDLAAFRRFHGLFADEMAHRSVAGALATLDARDTILARVRRIVGANQRTWEETRGPGPKLAGPVAFDAPVAPDGDALARRCVRRSVLVCPGSFFGAPRGVRVGLTRPSFARDLPHYLAIRDRTR